MAVIFWPQRKSKVRAALASAAFCTVCVLTSSSGVDATGEFGFGPDWMQDFYGLHGEMMRDAMAQARNEHRWGMDQQDSEAPAAHNKCQQRLEAEKIQRERRNARRDRRRKIERNENWQAHEARRKRHEHHTRKHRIAVENNDRRHKRRIRSIGRDVAFHISDESISDDIFSDEFEAIFNPTPGNAGGSPNDSDETGGGQPKPKPTNADWIAKNAERKHERKVAREARVRNLPKPATAVGVQRKAEITRANEQRRKDRQKRFDAGNYEYLDGDASLDADMYMDDEEYKKVLGDKNQSGKDAPKHEEEKPIDGGKVQKEVDSICNGLEEVYNNENMINGLENRGMTPALFDMRRTEIVGEMKNQG